MGHGFLSSPRPNDFFTNFCLILKISFIRKNTKTGKTDKISKLSMDNPTKIKLICKRFISKPHKKTEIFVQEKKKFQELTKSKIRSNLY